MLQLAPYKEADMLTWHEEYIDLGLRQPGQPIAHVWAMDGKLYRIVHFIGFGQKYQATVYSPGLDDCVEAYSEFVKLADAKAWCEAQTQQVAA